MADNETGPAIGQLPTERGQLRQPARWLHPAGIYTFRQPPHSLACLEWGPPYRVDSSTATDVIGSAGGFAPSEPLNPLAVPEKSKMPPSSPTMR